jgi:hypothetical protein
MSNVGSQIINQMVEELLGIKSRLGDTIEQGTVASITLHNLKKFDGWDIRISIGPPGAFDNPDDEDDE